MPRKKTTKPVKMAEPATGIKTAEPATKPKQSSSAHWEAAVEALKTKSTPPRRPRGEW